MSSSSSSSSRGECTYRDGERLVCGIDRLSDRCSVLLCTYTTEGWSVPVLCCTVLYSMLCYAMVYIHSIYTYIYTYHLHACVRVSTVSMYRTVVYLYRSLYPRRLSLSLSLDNLTYIPPAEECICVLYTWCTYLVLTCSQYATHEHLLIRSSHGILST